MTKYKFLCFMTSAIFFISNTSESKHNNLDMKKEIQTIQNSNLSDTISFYSYYFKEVEYLYLISHDKQKKEYELRNLKRSGSKKVVKYDSIGILESSIWYDNIAEKITQFNYNEMGQLKKVNKLFTKEDSLQLHSIEKYTYKNELLNSFYYMDYDWSSNPGLLREMFIHYKYDKLQRTKNATVKYKNAGRFRTKDSIRYFYEADQLMPKTVLRTYENNTSHHISYPSKNIQVIKTIYPSLKDDVIFIETLVLDDKNRVIEFVLTKKFESPTPTSTHKRYLIDYSKKTNVQYMPELLWNSIAKFPKTSSFKYVDSKVNPGCFNDIEIRPNINLSEMPSLVTSFNSSDSVNWQHNFEIRIH